jgi:hypothetical protein
LPSKDELNEMYQNRSKIGGFSANSYWSSTENLYDDAWKQSFNDGYQGNDGKNGYDYVRSVRAF